MDDLESSNITHPKIEYIVISTLASMFAAALVISAFYPIECIEAKAQLGQLENSSIFTSLRTTKLRKNYSGCLASVLGHIFAWGSFILISESCKYYLKDYKNTHFVLFFSCISYLDAVGAFSYITVFTPFSTIKIKLIAEPQYENSIKKYLEALKNKKKFLELYSGYALSLMYILEGAIQLYLYEMLKRKHSSYFYFFLIGVISKFVAITLTYPYRLLVSLVQSRSGSLKNSLKKVMRFSGIIGLYNGYFPCIARQLPIAGFLFMILELFRSVISQVLHSLKILS